MKRIPVILAGVMLALLSFGAYTGTASAAGPTDAFADDSPCPWADQFQGNATGYGMVPFWGGVCRPGMDPTHALLQARGVYLATEAFIKQLSDEIPGRSWRASDLPCANEDVAFGAIHLNASGLFYTGAPLDTRNVWTGAGGVVTCTSVPAGNDALSVLIKLTGQSEAQVIASIIDKAWYDKHLVTADAVRYWLRDRAAAGYTPGGHPGQVISAPGTVCDKVDAVTCLGLLNP